MKNQLKKSLSLLMAVLMVISMAACTKTEEKDEEVKVPSLEGKTHEEAKQALGCKCGECACH